jgi:hypothetical protein
MTLLLIGSGCNYDVSIPSYGSSDVLIFPTPDRTMLLESCGYKDKIFSSTTYINMKNSIFCLHSVFFCMVLKPSKGYFSKRQQPLNVIMELGLQRFEIQPRKICCLRGVFVVLSTLKTEKIMWRYFLSSAYSLILLLRIILR